MISGFIFDVDGVLVNSPHEQAWGDTLARVMRDNWPELIPTTTYSPERYTSGVYQAHVAGKPRNEGAAALLAYFGIDDPDGEKCRTLCEEKQLMIVRLIDEGRFEAYADALRFLVRAKAGGAVLAAASSSKNANRMMSRVRMLPFRNAPDRGFISPETTLLDVFQANVCGWEFRRGKPDPEIFLTAARMLGTEPSASVVIEDAPAGVQAAGAAGMACIGIARCGDEDILRAAGADWVVTSLDDIDPSGLAPTR